ncbi:MAG: cob(I)yrinic acid a,c-diamide adenosyltransferase [Planctomycetes bacterium]|nr:cob(I)yrinic acid a,c-diamide adenosyltransferase [Planctomycetota bacterium]
MSWKIYTRGGDKGSTALVGGKRVKKSDARVDVYGTADELNSHLGMLRSLLSKEKALFSELDVIKGIQNKLFDIGSYLATPKDDAEGLGKIVQDPEITLLEKKIDFYSEGPPAMTTFILPGGGVVASQAHIARTVCRRLERQCVAFSEKDELDAPVMKYINRLSDFLFAFSRYISWKLGEEEFKWEKAKNVFENS